MRLPLSLPSGAGRPLPRVAPALLVVLGLLAASAALVWAMDAASSRWALAGVLLAALALGLARSRRTLAAAQRRHRALLDALGEGVVVIPADEGAPERNQTAARILRGTLADAEILAADGTPLPRAAWPWTLTRATGQPCTGRELGLRRGDGSVVWILASTHALRTQRPGVAPHEVVLSFADITPQRAAVAELACAHAELARRATELERSNADLEQLACVASHDLSEPLRSVTSYLSLLRRRYEGRLGEDADLFMDHAMEGASRMRALIDDLLAYARVGRGEEGRRTAAVDLDETVAATLRALGPAIVEAGGRVECEPLPRVTGDPALLGQLLQNLIANALKFRGDEPPLVRVGARREAAGWQVTVADNGVGIEPEQAERIFGMFQRGREGEGFAGTGMGLAICRRIVERHGGRLWVEATPGGGATFAFTLPDAPSAARGRPGRFGPRTRSGVPAGIR